MNGSSSIPTCAELAAELARNNDRCGHIDQDGVCLRPDKHAGEHKYEPIHKVIPIH